MKISHTTIGLMSVDETTEYLGIGRTTLYRLIDSGEIAVVKIRRRSLFRLADVDDYIERRVSGD